MATRTKLLCSARLLFGTEGYHATSIKCITTHAGIGVGTFYKHFGSKRDVLLELMTEVLERISTLDLRPAPARTMQIALREHFNEIFRQDLELFHVFRAWHEVLGTDAELLDSNAALIAWSNRNVERLFQHLLTLPNARVDRDVRSLASLVNQYTWTLLGRAALIPADEFNQQMKTIADLVYHYFYRDRCSE